MVNCLIPKSKNSVGRRRVRYSTFFYYFFLGCVLDRIVFTHSVCQVPSLENKHLEDKPNFEI